MGAMDSEVRHGPTSRRYLPEQKDHAVGMVLALGEELGSSAGTVVRVAGRLGLGEESVRCWVAQTEIDAGACAGVSSAESAEIKKLRQENRELRRANEVLRRAAVVFGAELDRRQR